MAGDRHAIRDDAARKAWALEKLPGGCQVCGTRKPDFRGFSVHHILGGRAGRSDEPCNYLLTCGICHDLLENRTIRDGNGLVIPTIPLGMALTIKWWANIDDFDLFRMMELSNGVRLPHMIEPHPWIKKARTNNKMRPPIPCEIEAERPKDFNKIIDEYEILR